MELALPYQPFERARWIGPPCVSVVSDDGYKEDLTELAPLLEQHGARGTFGVCTEFTGRRGFLAHDDIQELASRGHEIASHMVRHAPAVNLSDHQCRQDMAASKATLTSMSSAPVGSLVFPYGSASRRTRALASGHFDCAMVSWPGLNVGTLNRFALRRVGFGSFEHPKYPVAAAPEKWIQRLVACSGWLILMLHPGEPRRDPHQNQRLDRFLSSSRRSGIAVLTVAQARQHLSPVIAMPHR